MEFLWVWATQGLSWPDVGLFLMRLGVGLPFAISGWNKLTCPICKGYLQNNLKRSGIPNPHNCVSVWVAFWEFLAGITLILGLFTGLSAFILFIVCAVAFKVSWRRKLEKKNPVHFLDACTEVGFQFDLLLIWLVLGIGFIGPGGFSLDHLLGWL